MREAEAIALIHTGLGEPRLAVERLERAFEVRSTGGLFTLRQPCWDPLRSEPRFQDLQRRIGQPPDTGR